MPTASCSATVPQLSRAFPQTVAIGVNCTHPSLITALIGELRAASDKPIIVYPNSGEGWDAQARCWTGSSDPEAYGIKATEWFGRRADRRRLLPHPSRAYSPGQADCLELTLRRCEVKSGALSTGFLCGQKCVQQDKPASEPSHPYSRERCLDSYPSAQ